MCYIESYISVFLRCVLSQIIEKLNIKKYVHNGTKAYPNMPLDIEERKKVRRRERRREGEKERRMEGQKIQTEAYDIDGRRLECVFLWSIVYLV